MTLHPATAVTPKTSNSLKSKLLSFHARLAEDGPVHVTAIQLAKDGFRYDEETGHVICEECNLQLKDFCNYVDTYVLHQLYSPNCPFLSHGRERHQAACENTGQRSSKVPDVLSDSCSTGKLRPENREKHDSLQHLGIQRISAECPELAVEDRRKTTFLTYPHSGGKVDTEKLCNAGYFYEGDGTAVTCFSCGLISGDWGSNEDPWKRHARSSTSCQFIIDQKGGHFVAESVEELGEYRKPNKENIINNVTPRMLRPRWDSGPVQKALSMGMNRESVRTVISNRIQQGKPDYQYVAEICQDVEDLAVPEQELSTQPEFKLPTVVQLPSDPVTEDLQSSEQSESAVDVTEEVRVTSDSAVTTLDTSESTSAATSSTEDLTRIVGEAKTWISKLTCSVCLSNAVGIMFLPCTHLVCCVDCAAAVLHCPICRHEIRGTVRSDLRHLE